MIEHSTPYKNKNPMEAYTGPGLSEVDTVHGIWDNDPDLVREKAKREAALHHNIGSVALIDFMPDFSRKPRHRAPQPGEVDYVEGNR